MGGDSLHDLPTWNKPLEFIKVCDGIGVMRRHADKVDLESLERSFRGERQSQDRGSSDPGDLVKADQAKDH